MSEPISEHWAQAWQERTVIHNNNKDANVCSQKNVQNSVESFVKARVKFHDSLGHNHNERLDRFGSAEHVRTEHIDLVPGQR